MNGEIDGGMSELVATATTISMVLVMLGLFAACIRLVLGPSRADRVVALDLVTMLLVAISALLAIDTGLPAYLDLGLALALIGFLATVAFSRYVESRPGREPDRAEVRPAASPVKNTTAESES